MRKYVGSAPGPTKAVAQYQNPMLGQGPNHISMQEILANIYGGWEFQANL